MTDVVLRLASGPLAGQSFLDEGPIPAATIDITDIDGSSHVYLRTYARVTDQPEAWLYVPANPEMTLPEGYTRGTIPCGHGTHTRHCLAAAKATA